MKNQVSTPVIVAVIAVFVAITASLGIFFVNRNADAAPPPPMTGKPPPGMMPGMAGGQSGMPSNAQAHNGGSSMMQAPPQAHTKPMMPGSMSAGMGRPGMPGGMGRPGMPGGPGAMPPGMQNMPPGMQGMPPGGMQNMPPGMRPTMSPSGGAPPAPGSGKDAPASETQPTNQ